MRPTCEIQWIDVSGRPTPDTNPSIGRIRTKARVEQIGGVGVRFEASPWFHVCACHAEQMDRHSMLHGMHIWEWECISHADA